MIVTGTGDKSSSFDKNLATSDAENLKDKKDTKAIEDKVEKDEKKADAKAKPSS